MRVAIILGPYRNLTTLTAAILALHPKCQVLNHAANRILADDEINFLSRPDRATFDRFVEAALEASKGGKQGVFGGSILFSHAYRMPSMKGMYENRYGDEVFKPEASCLVWKDSMRVQQPMMEDPELFDRLCDTFPELSFLLPIRDPLDCAVSNLRTRHIRHLGGSATLPLNEAVDKVLDAFAWVLAKRDKRPDRVFVFTQYDQPEELFHSLAAFLDVDPVDTWMKDALGAFKMRRQYKHRWLARHYVRRAAAKRLKPWPDILHRLGIERPFAAAWRYRR